LRKRPVFGRRSPAQRLFQVVWHVGANENSLAIRHLSQPLFQQVGKACEALECKAQREQVYKPNSVSRSEISNLKFEVALIQDQQLTSKLSISVLRSGGDHSSSPTVASWIKRSTRRSSPDESGVGRAALFDASLFDLALRGVCLAARVTTRAGALLL
jgi:hypothetical protein